MPHGQGGAGKGATDPRPALSRGSRQAAADGTLGHVACHAEKGSLSLSRSGRWCQRPGPQAQGEAEGGWQQRPGRRQQAGRSRTGAGEGAATWRAHQGRGRGSPCGLASAAGAAPGHGPPWARREQRLSGAVTCQVCSLITASGGEWGAACCPPFWAVLPSPQQAAPGLRPRPCEPRAGVSQAARGDGATSSADPTSPRWPWGWSGRDRPAPSTQKPVTGLGPLPCPLALSPHPSGDAGRLGTRTGHEWRSGSVHS